MRVSIPFDEQGRDKNNQPHRRLVFEASLSESALFSVGSNWSIWVWAGHLGKVLNALGDRVEVVGFESCTFDGKHLQPRLDYNDTYSPRLQVAETIAEIDEWDWEDDEPGLFLEIFVNMKKPIEVDGVIDATAPLANGSRESQSQPNSRTEQLTGPNPGDGTLLIVSDQTDIAGVGRRMLMEACLAERATFRMEPDKSVWILEEHIAQVFEALSGRALLHGLAFCTFDGPAIAHLPEFGIEFASPIDAIEGTDHVEGSASDVDRFVNANVRPGNGTRADGLLDLSFLEIRPRLPQGFQNPRREGT